MMRKIYEDIKRYVLSSQNLSYNSVVEVFDLFVDLSNCTCIVMQYLSKCIYLHSTAGTFYFFIL